MRTFILCFGILGTLVFGAAFALSFSSPLLVEKLGKEIIRIEIERRLGTQLDALSGSRMAGLAQKLPAIVLTTIGTPRVHIGTEGECMLLQ